MTPPDIRAFYTALGIQIPGWAPVEATSAASPTRRPPPRRP